MKATTPRDRVHRRGQERITRASRAVSERGPRARSVSAGDKVTSSSADPIGRRGLSSIGTAHGSHEKDPERPRNRERASRGKGPRVDPVEATGPQDRVHRRGRQRITRAARTVSERGPRLRSVSAGDKVTSTSADPIDPRGLSSIGSAHVSREKDPERPRDRERASRGKHPRVDPVEATTPQDRVHRRGRQRITRASRTASDRGPRPESVSAEDKVANTSANAIGRRGLSSIGSADASREKDPERPQRRERASPGKRKRVDPVEATTREGRGHRRGQGRSTRASRTRVGGAPTSHSVSAGDEVAGASAYPIGRRGQSAIGSADAWGGGIPNDPESEKSVTSRRHAMTPGRGNDGTRPSRRKRPAAHHAPIENESRRGPRPHSVSAGRGGRKRLCVPHRSSQPEGDREGGRIGEEGSRATP